MEILTIIHECPYYLKVTPHTKCRLKLLKLERIKDYLLMEEEFIRNQVYWIFETQTIHVSFHDRV